MPQFTVDAAAGGSRLDRWLAGQLPDISRTRLRTLIDDGHVQIDGKRSKAAHRLRPGEQVDIEIPPRPPETLQPERIALEIVFEDEHLLVVNKPAGMVVHPGAGHISGTLASAVLAHAPSTAGVGGPRRPGVVHRLDKGTSGLLVVAKTQAAYESLVAQLQARTVTRRYVAVVHGRLARGSGVVDAPLGRHPHDRKRMAVQARGKGKRAVTRWRMLEEFRDFALIEARLETGRTHQIRVHMASIGHPVAGDDTYGARRRLPVPLQGLALHAETLGFMHPATGRPVEFSASIPQRLELFVSNLRHSG